MTFVLMALAVSVVAPAPEEVVVVMDSPSSAYQSIVDSLVDTGAKVQRVLVTAPSIADRFRHRDPREIWLAAGPRSARFLSTCAASCAAVVLRTRDVPAGLPAVTLDVPLKQQLSWLKTAFYGRQRVVLLRDPTDPVHDATAARAAADLSLDLDILDVHTAGEAVPVLEAALRHRPRETVVWLLPDAKTVNADTIAPLIQTALARRVPVVGFTQYFLRVGALAALEINIPAMAQRAVALGRSGSNQVLPPPAARLVVNARLAERLGVLVHGGAGIEVQR